jgi:hypothetical protein
LDSIRIFDNFETDIKQPNKLNLTDMKILKQSLTLFALIGVFSTTALAQIQNADVNVSAVVEASLTLTPAAVDFGTIEPLASYLQANGNDATAASNTTGTAGSLTIDGTDGISVDVSFTNATLENGNGSQITFTPTVYNATTGVSSGDAVTLSGGQAILDIGGALTAPSESGTYNTTTGGGSPVTFTVQYN